MAVVVYLDESGMVFILRGITRRPVRFITDNQIEREARRCLRLMHYINGLIRGKNDR